MTVIVKPKARSVAFIGLSKNFGTTIAVDNVDLAIAPGEFCTLLGPSGSGKTTLLKLVAGFEEPSAGAIEIGGQRVDTVPVAERNIGIVFQNYALFPHKTVAENIAFPLRMRNQRKAEIMAKVAAALELVDLAGLGERYPRQLSGGQQQRVALARALVFEPDILLMDEPLGALDKNLREAIQQELRDLHRRLGVTMLYVTHDQAEALYLSDRIVVLEKGGIAQVGTPEALYGRPATAFVARFLGDCNLIAGELSPEGVTIAPGVRIAAPEGAAGRGSVTVGCRPEHTKIVLAGTAGSLPGRIVDAAFLGTARKLLIEAAGTRILALVDPDAEHRSEAAVGILLPPAKTFILQR
jgi:putative spermidine/putrescine transport system ATP-binding protein